MARAHIPAVTDVRGRTLVTSFVGLSVLVLAGCAQTDGSGTPAGADAASSDAITLTPTHGSVQGGNRVFVDAEGSPEGPVTVAFGDSPGVECEFDADVRRHACVAPRREDPGIVEVAVTADGNTLAEKASYAYTTPGTQVSPVLTVDTSAVQRNAEEIRNEFPSGVQLGAVLKNGEPVDVFGNVIEDAADPEYFFVPKLDDAITLRESGVTAKIAVMYVMDTADIPLLVHYDIEVAATAPAWAEEAERILAEMDAELNVHLWIDTGLAREGVVPEEALPLARAIEGAEHLNLAGIATHFCCIAEGDVEAIESNDATNATVVQKNRFDAAVEQIRGEGLGQDALIHAGASDVLANDIESLYYDMLRIGGMFFASSAPDDFIYSWTTEIDQVKTLPEDWCIDYGCEERTQVPTKVGLISHIPSRDEAIVFTVNGREVPVLLDHGTVVTLDLTGVPETSVGDEVTIDFSPETDHLLEATPPLPVTVGTGG